MDECAYLDPGAWYEVGAPMMADRDGTTYFYSTPARKNWFYQLYNRAVSDTTGRWAAFHATTHDNPHLSAAAVAELAGDMTSD
ncbi:terminase large subunit domain-containing protein, partial [Listeria monocytogenes]|uniref:terminase large subunit domain-containing protein n=1 Tax=Listeria monocytogenes TaxID=1639 RepID=UPI002FDBA96F